jgi:hypothetical protein
MAMRRGFWVRFLAKATRAVGGPTTRKVKKSQEGRPFHDESGVGD